MACPLVSLSVCLSVCPSIGQFAFRSVSHVFIRSQKTLLINIPFSFVIIFYRRDPNKSGGGTQLLHAPPTAHMVQSIFSFAVAVDTLGGYNWRHRGDFSISTFNPLKGPNLDQNLRKKIIQFSELLEWFGGVQGGN